MAANLWFFYALGAAVLWGLGYVLAEKLLRGGMPPSFLIFIECFVAIPLCIVLMQTLGAFKEGLSVMFQNKTMIALTIFMGFCVMIGNFLIMTSISHKNATLANMIEITYPIFTFIFAYFILKDVQLTWATGLGALLIFSGVGVILLKG